VYVALKSYSKQALVKHQKVEEAMNEKLALQRLQGHPLIIGLLATFQTDDSLFFVLEYCPFGDLVDVVRRHEAQRLPLPQCWQIVRELLNVVAYIHRHQVLHRDIKGEREKLTLPSLLQKWGGLLVTAEMLRDNKCHNGCTTQFLHRSPITSMCTHWRADSFHFVAFRLLLCNLLSPPCSVSARKIPLLSVGFMQSHRDRSCQAEVGQCFLTN
jgi:serine/threonine protein kinase